MTLPCLLKFSHLPRHCSLLILLSLTAPTATPIIILCSPHEPPLPCWSDAFLQASTTTSGGWPPDLYYLFWALLQQLHTSNFLPVNCIRISSLFFKLRTSKPELILPLCSPPFTSCPTSPLSLYSWPISVSSEIENLGGSEARESCPISFFSFRSLRFS